MNSQQLWLPVDHLHRIKPANIPPWVEKELMSLQPSLRANGRPGELVCCWGVVSGSLLMLQWVHCTQVLMDYINQTGQRVGERKREG